MKKSGNSNHGSLSIDEFALRRFIRKIAILVKIL